MNTTDLHLFDCNCMLGKFENPNFLTESTYGAYARWGAAPSSFTKAKELMDEMDHYGIEEALIYHASAKEKPDRAGNQMLLENVKGTKRLHVCWVLAATMTSKIKNYDRFVKDMLSSGVEAVRFFPHDHNFELDQVEEFVRILEEHRVPLMIDWGVSMPHCYGVVDWDATESLVKEHDNLPVILAFAASHSDTILYPMLEKYSNLIVDWSSFWRYRALEAICKLYGPEHAIFGSNAPFYYPGGAITDIIYSEISQSERKLVAGDNLRRLTGGVKK